MLSLSIIYRLKDYAPEPLKAPDCNSC
jgi:hypothetical protein